MEAWHMEAWHLEAWHMEAWQLAYGEPVGRNDVDGLAFLL